jgi:hypothetical protein
MLGRRCQTDGTHRHPPFARSVTGPLHGTAKCKRYSVEGLRVPMCLFLLCFLFHLTLHASEAAGQDSQSPYTERIKREFKFYPGGKIQITSGLPGNLKVVGWQRGSVVLEAEKVFYRMTPEDAKQLSKQIAIQVHYTQTAATIRTSGPQQQASVEINTTLYVPKDKTDLKIQVSHGDFSIDSVSGWVEATLQEGSIEAKSGSGYFSLLTQQGDLDVQLSGKHWDGLGFTAVTHRGKVSLGLPVEYSAALQLETRNGNFTLDYPEQLVDGESVPLAVVTDKVVRSLTATVGEGGAPIRIHTGAGDIQLMALRAR